LIVTIFFYQEEERRIALVMARKEEEKKRDVNKTQILKVTISLISTFYYYHWVDTSVGGLLVPYLHLFSSLPLFLPLLMLSFFLLPDKRK
jgi:hypothetical protein